jgi:hypothetical protein
MFQIIDDVLFNNSLNLKIQLLIEKLKHKCISMWIMQFLNVK